MEMEGKVIRFLASVLRDNGSMHYNQLISYMSSASFDIKGFFSGHDGSDKYWFFKNNSKHFVVANSGYISLLPKYPEQSSSFIPKKTRTNEEKVVDFMIDTLQQHGEMHFNRLVDQLASSSTNVRYFFDNKDDSDKHWFFKNHSDEFIVENSGYISLASTSSKSDKERPTNQGIQNKPTEEKVVDFLVCILQTNGSMHFNPLTKYLHSSSHDIKHFFDDYDDSQKYWFFKNYPDNFIVENNGYISHSVRASQKKLQENALTTEEKLINFLVSILRTEGPLHYTRLVKSLSEATVDIKHYFAKQDKSDIHWFFKNHSDNFVVQNSGCVSSTGEHLSELVIPNFDTVRDTSKTPPFSPVRLQISRNYFTLKASEEKVCDFLISALKCKGPLHFHKIPALLASSSSDISQFFQDYDNSDLFHFFKNQTKDFHVESSGYISAKNHNGESDDVIPSNKKTKEEKVIDFLIQILRMEEPLHFNHLIDKMSSASFSIRNFFNRKDDSEKFWFFKTNSDKFKIENNGYVSRSTRINDRLMNEQIGNEFQSLEQQVSDFLFSLLKTKGSMHFNQLIRNMTLAPADIKNFFHTSNGSEKYSFFKDHPDYFITQNNGYISATNRSLTNAKQVCSSKGKGYTQQDKAMVSVHTNDHLESKSRTNEERVKDFLDILLLVHGPMHYKQLIKVMMQHRHEYCDFFELFQDKEKYEFFKRFSQDFIIGPNGFVRGRSWHH